MHVRSLLVIAGIMAFMLNGAVVAQPLKIAARGTKTIALSDRVGRNQFTWTSEAPLEKIKGTAEGVVGALTVDPANLSTLRGTLSARVSTMNSGNATRDEHMKSPQWLDAAAYPEIRFAITSIARVKVAGNKATGTATGTFTMHGVSRQLAIPFSLVWLKESAATKKRAPGDLVMFAADFTVALGDFNVAGARGVVGSKVGESIKISAKLFGAAR